MLASQAQEIYKEYWDDYFKFSFVRNPWTRLLSLALMGVEDRFIPTIDDDGNIDVSGFVDCYGFPTTIEYDLRFWDPPGLEDPRFQPGQAYTNITGNDLDFVGKFENLVPDVSYIEKQLSVPEGHFVNQFGATHLYNTGAKRTKTCEEYYDDTMRDMVQTMYENDCKKYGYEFNSTTNAT